MSARGGRLGALGRCAALGLVALALAGCSRALTDRVGSDTDVDDTDASVDDTDPGLTSADPDVLFVIHNAAMIEARLKLIAAAPSLLFRLQDSGTDWHVGVITADVDDSTQNGTLQGPSGHAFVDASASDPSAAFSEIADVGDAGSLTGAGLRAASRALLMPTPQLQQANAGFVRTGDRVVIVVLSDDDDASRGSPTGQDFARDIGALPGASSVTFSAIVGPDPDGCESAELRALAGTTYNRVAAAMGGRSYSICDDDYAAILDAIGRDAVQLP